MLETRLIDCPYCGEKFEITVDLSAGSQDYVEDCYVCCRPMQISLQVDYQGELMSINVVRDDE